MSDNTRLAMELELLEAMYPNQTKFHPASQDFKFHTSQAASLHLRLPEVYPELERPEVIAANDDSKRDIRDKLREAIGSLDVAQGEEILDAIIACFQEMVEQVARSDMQNNVKTVETAKVHDGTLSHCTSPASEPSQTVIVWLHHLLALSKRKLATSPPTTVRAIIKPGYPGIMIFSGPRSAVSDHVNLLKAENWQAFQVRYEGEELWEFSHGAKAVREVETMAEVVKILETGEHGAKRKEEFLKAAGIK